MYELIRKYNKKLLAVFGVFLMIVFVLPTTQAGRSDPVFGKAGDQTIRLSEATAARSDWELLSRSLQTIVPELGNSPVPLAATLGSVDARRLQGGGPIPFTLINDHPDTFLLLKTEARAAGLAVSPERAKAYLDNQVMNRPRDPGQYDRALRAIQSFLLVQDYFARVSSVAKVSQPAAERELVRRGLALYADVVPFDAASAAGSMAEPTDEQIRKQFESFAGELPQLPKSGTNPFGFGYRIPDRVKLQSLSYTPEQLEGVVRAKRSDREWEVLARKYYLERLPQFQIPAPPSTQPLAMPAAPTTQPFEDARSRAIDAVMKPEVDRLNQIVREGISRRLGDDLAAATANGQTPSPEFASHQYLEGIASAIQKEHGFLPTVTSLQESWTSVDQLAMLPGLGQAAREQTSVLDQVQSSAALAAEPGPGAQKLLEMSRPFTGGDGSTYYFRLTAAEKAHNPESVDLVREQVIKDLKLVAALEAARSDAQALVSAAQTAGLTDAAAKAGKSIVPTGPIPSPSDFRLAVMPITGFDPAGARVEFAERVYDLLTSETKDPAGRPMGVIELPAAGKVTACLITRTDRQYNPQLAGLLPTVIAEGLRAQTLEGVESDWFSHDGVVARTGYTQVLR